MRRGIIVGKFMPLHRGHQLLIETALSYVDDLTIVVYDSHPAGSYTSMPVQKRMRWISTLYPGVENVLSRQDIVIDGSDNNDPKYAKPYADDLEFLGKFDYVFSSEPYGEAFAAALGAKSVVVDQARTMLPISGTTLREHLYENRGWMDPIVYRSLIQKVVFVGTESTGKSTLSKALAEEYNTQWVHEYGRELWEAQGLTGSFRDLLKIAEVHRRREDMMTLNSREYLFCDTNAWTTLHWSLMYSGSADARLYKMVDESMKDYIWIECSDDFGWINDGTRELSNGKAHDFHRVQMMDLRDRDIPFSTVRGSVEQRIAQVKEILALTPRI